MPALEKDLDYYGEGFKYRLVKSFIEKPSDFVEIESYLNPKIFNDDRLAFIVTKMKEFYREYGRVPSYVDLEYHLKDNVKKQEDLDAIYTTFKKIKDEEFFDGMFKANEIGVEFIKRNETLHQLDLAKNSIKSSGYEASRLTRIIENLQSIENNGNVECFTPGEMFEEIMTENKSDRVKSGIEILDNQMNGGLARSTTGLLIAGTGVGKTTLFSIMACKSAICGNKVLYIFFEDKDTDFCRKFYSNRTKRPTDDFHKDSPKCKEAEVEVREEFRKHPEIKEAFFKNVKAMRMANGETEIETLKIKIRSLIVSGWKPDIVFLDYIQCMKSSSDGRMSIDKEYATLDRLMKRLDAFAQEENFALWVAQQTNRDGNKKDSPDRIGNIQGSFRLCQTASAILYLERNNETENDYNRINLYLDKCRGASLGAWKGAYMNNGTCQLKLEESGYDPNSPFNEKSFSEETGEVFENEEDAKTFKQMQEENSF